MKKALFIVLSLFMVSCEIYQQPSDPNFTGGKWIFLDYEIVTISSISEIDVTKSDTVCINAFDKQIFLSGGDYLLKQVYANTAQDRRFIRNKTIWEFDSYGHYLYCNFKNENGSITPSHEPFWVSFPKNYWEYESSRMVIRNQMTGAVTNWSFKLNAMGQGPATKMTLISPEIVTNLYGPSGGRDKAVTVRVVLNFMR